MAAKTLKFNFSNYFFKLLFDIKLILMNSESDSAMTGLPSVLVQPKLICYVALSDNS